MIDTDTRQLRRDFAGDYRTGGGKRICDHCGVWQTCDVELEHNRCELFMPALPFTDETGLGHIANTIRIGMAWTDRLDVGQTVALYNTRTKQIFGHSTVLFTEWGPIAEMLKKHAHANHIMLNTPRAKAGVELLNWLRGNYGPRIIHQGTKLTAIYLLRQHQPNAAPLIEGDEAARQTEGEPQGPR